MVSRKPFAGNVRPGSGQAVMNDARTIRSLVVAALLVLTLGTPVRALDPSQPPSSYLRTHYTTETGLVASVIDATAQTQDGFLWLIVNGHDLARFDGKRFSHFIKAELDSQALAVAPDGDLWLGTTEGLVHVSRSDLSQSKFNAFESLRPGPGAASRILSLRISRDGGLVAGTGDGLFRYDGARFHPLGPRVATNRVEEAPDGHLFLMTNEGFFELAGNEVIGHPGLAERLGVREREIFHVLRGRDGNTWYCTQRGVAREKHGRIEKLGTYAPTGHAAYRAYEDPQGTVWIAGEEGVFRATSAGLEPFAPGMKARSLYSDRDGNLWIGTNGDGLYRFKDRAARTYTTADGLPGNVIMAVIEAHDGAIWSGANCGGLSRFDGVQFQTFNEKHGLLNSCVWALAEDANHDLWIGTYGGGAFRYRDGRFTQYSTSQGMPSDTVLTIIAARDGAVWFGTRRGLVRLQNGRLRTFTTADGLSADDIESVFEDRAGVIWATTATGLDRLADQRFVRPTDLSGKDLLPLGEDRKGAFYAGVRTDPWWATRRFYKGRVDTFIDLAAYDMVETDQGELWFTGGPICRVPPGAFEQSRGHDEPLDFEEFSTADGLATGNAVGRRNLALTRDGKLWVATPSGLAQFDLRRLPLTKAKTSIYLTEVVIGRNTQPAGHSVVLPPGTNHVEISFAAVEISSPEKIRMQYRLDGVDSEWLDAPADRRAVYTRIPVGTHALRIRACNRNGIWDRKGVAFTVTQLPYFYQTRSFIAVMFALGLLLVGLIYRLRVRQLSRQLNARFDERLAERLRVAREIHDTFLQTVQGSKLVADHALKNPGDHQRAFRALEQLSAWLAQATDEGRSALNSLRSSATETNDLAAALRRAIEECRVATAAEISLSVRGDSREMHPVVRDEVYRIGYEAIRNSCTHSGGDRIEVSLDYGHDLTLRVGDNGAGIDPGVVESGSEGHFGLRGMRERAERVGSNVTLVSSPHSGTLITLVVPGRIAFRSARRRWWRRQGMRAGRD